MLNFNINLTSLAVILWSGMLIIAGSIWVLSSQVRRLADILEDRSKSSAPAEGLADQARWSSSTAQVRVARRGASIRARGAVRTAVAGTSGQMQLLAPRRNGTPPVRSIAIDDAEAASEA
jgi:hypothetical protein